MASMHLEFGLRADIQKTAIDPSIRYLKTWGCVQLDIGGGLLRRTTVAPVDPTNFGWVQSLDKSWWTYLYDNQEITWPMFGMLPGQSPASTVIAANNKAMNDSIAWARQQIPSKVIPLTVPTDTWRLSTSIPAVEGLVLNGDGHVVDDFFHGPEVYNSTRDMFDFPVGKTRGVNTTGIGFNGGGRRVNLLPDGLNGQKVLQWSTWDRCGFKNFNAIFRGAYTLLKVTNSWLNSSNYPLHLKGSDVMIRDNNIGGQGSIYVDPATGAQSAARDTDFVVFLDNLHLSRIVGLNFITGRPSIPLGGTGNLVGTIIDGTHLDIANKCGAAFKSARGFSIGNVTVNKCGYKMDGDVRGLIDIENCQNYRVGTVIYSHNENVNPGPIPIPTPTTLRVSGASSNGYVDEAVYADGYTRKVVIEAGTEAPRFANVGAAPAPLPVDGPSQEEFDKLSAASADTAQRLTDQKAVLDHLVQWSKSA